MKTVGLIAEYNPFHNGHEYHIKKAKEITGADTAIIIMSGNYVQRGVPAFMPKHLRTKIALYSGAAAVIELPVCYATGSAEYFAKGAISLLNQLNCIDSICFGCECDEPELLENAAHILSNESDKYQSTLQHFLKNGDSFPLARQKALSSCCNNEKFLPHLFQPNNILAIEYIKALYQSNSQMKWTSIHREGAHYHDNTLSDGLASATAIRNSFSENTLSLAALLEKLVPYVPASALKSFKENYCTRYPIFANDFSLLLKYKLLFETPESLSEYLDVSKELANRIINNLNKYRTFEQFCMLLKTRELTYTRISRALLHVLLDIKKEDLHLFLQNGTTFYAHILGFQRNHSGILTIMKQQSRIPLITRFSETRNLNGIARTMWNKNLFASNVYESVLAKKYDQPFQNDSSHPVLLV